MAEDGRAGQLRRLGPVGERLGGRLEVGPVQLDPLAPDPHQRPGLGGEAVDVGGVELDVVDHHRPADGGQLGGAHLGLAPERLGVQLEAGGGTLAGQGAGRPRRSRRR